MKEHIRFGTAEGNVWIAKSERGYVAAATRAELKERDPVLDRIAIQVVSRYTELALKPLLVVGCSTFLRANMPSFMMQSFDVYLFFYPNAAEVWVCGALAVDRNKKNAAPIWAYAADWKSETAAKQALWGLIGITNDPDRAQIVPEKLNTWLMQWAYRCSKLSFRDLLQLESYPSSDLADHIKVNSFESKGFETIKPVFRLIKKDVA
jgi:hypothetical protein